MYKERYIILPDVMAAITAEARKFHEDARGSHDWDHPLRVTNLCLRIGKEEKADLVLLEVVGKMHDIGRKAQDEAGGTICHAAIGATMTREILERHDMAPEFVAAAVHCVACHRFRENSPPQSLEAKILFDSDKIDSIGATGIGRAFIFSGEQGARLHDPNVDLTKTSEYTREDTAYREFKVKLEFLKDRMLTPVGRRIAQARHRFMVEFFDQLNREVCGEI